MPAGPQQAAITGNPAFFTSLVTARVDRQTFPTASTEQMTEIEDTIRYFACGQLLRMDTEAAAAAYKTARNQAKLPGQTIICRDNGSLLDASGLVGDGAGNKAPITLSALQRGYFGSLPKQERPEYKMWQDAIANLTPMVDMQRNFQQAQVRNLFPVNKCQFMVCSNAFNQMHSRVCASCDLS